MSEAANKQSGAKQDRNKQSGANQERLMQVLLAPVVSEKSTYVADKNEQVVFRVVANATKPEIKAAVELLFKVQVDSVQVANVKGKEKRFGRFIGRRRHWKKAYVCLKPGQEINFAAGEAK
ncbi:MAG: 50S ribosomal protein L23 [Burkholderiales bacterium]|jgi:large subunit ribosomal protein L23